MPINGGSAAKAWEIDTRVIGTLGAGTRELIPEGRRVKTLFGTGVFPPTLEIQIVSGWIALWSTDQGGPYPVTGVNGSLLYYPGLPLSDGVDMRIRNAGGGDALDVEYSYEVQV